ncbi:MAG: VWA domain-containing protein [Phycisphaerales bacterium]
MSTPPEPTRPRLGGIVHTYLGYDPGVYPSPTSPPPDVNSAAFDHMLRFGSMRRLSPEELADAVRIDPSQIAGLGPSLEALIEMLEERKRKILETYETGAALREASKNYKDNADRVSDDDELADRFRQTVDEHSARALKMLWYEATDRPMGDNDPLGAIIVQQIERLTEKLGVEALAADYDFTGRTEMDVPTALRVKQELETIDRLLEQLREAMKDAKIGVIDLDELRDFVDEASVDQLRNFQQQIAELMEAEAKRQGLERDNEGAYRLTPKAYSIFQGKLLQEIFSDLQAARSGRHQGPIEGDGAVELPSTRPYEFGDSASQMDIPQSFINAMLRTKPGEAMHLRADDIEIHRTRNTPKCATAVIMDMSGSMRQSGQYIQCKRMAIALQGLIRREYPGDVLRFFEAYSIAKHVEPGRVVELLPKPVTIREPVVRLRADLSDPEVTEQMLPPHFTNIQHALRLARRTLAVQDTPNRQIMLITDGLPTAHFEGEHLYLLYPPDPLTERATMREAFACAREGITINLFLIPSWSQSSEDVQFAHRLAEATRGRVFFTGGGDLDRFVLWDYVSRRRRVIG